MIMLVDKDQKVPLWEGQQLALVSDGQTALVNNLLKYKIYSNLLALKIT